MTALTGGQAVVAALKAEGVEVVFGIPGTQNLPIFDALLDEPGIRLITNRHEQGSAYMADGYARASGRPGVVLTVSGPGAGNALSALGQAYSDSSPVLLLSSQVNTASLDRDAEDFHQMRDALRSFQGVTKWQGRARSVAAIPRLVRAAFAVLCSGRPRPAYLEIPQDVLFASGDAELLPPTAHQPLAPEPGLVERAAAVLASAERPVVYVGGGAIHAGAGEAILALAERLQAPVVMSPNGKGAVPEDHPLVVGSGWGAHQVGRAPIEQADVCLALGTRFGAIATEYWQLRFPRLIHVDVDPSELGKQYPPEVAIVGDARVTALALTDALDRSGHVARETGWFDVAAHRQARQAEIEARAGEALSVLRDLRAALPDEALLYHDLNTISYWGCAGLAVHQPRTFHYPHGFGCLGFGLPAAIGGKLARPDRPVVALLGDGGFLYTVHELATAVQHRLGVIVVVFNSEGYAAIKRDQERNWQGRTIGVDLASPDVARLARSFGARAIKAERLADVGPAVAEAIRQKGPTVVDAPCPDVAPPWTRE